MYRPLCLNLLKQKQNSLALQSSFEISYFCPPASRYLKNALFLFSKQNHAPNSEVHYALASLSPTSPDIRQPQPRQQTRKTTAQKIAARL
jgi:hypothetical protein